MNNYQRLKKAGFWVLVLIRHFFRQPGVMIPFAGILAGTFLLSLMDISQPVQIQAAVVSDGSFFAENVWRQLSNTDSIIQFYLCESKEQLNRDVAAGKAECGYLLEGEIEDRLRAGELEDILDSVQTPGTLVKGMADELVFASILSIYSPQVYAEYMSHTLTTDAASRQETARAAILEYEKFRTNGSTFKFQFSDDAIFSGQYEGTAAKTSFLRLRGIIAVMILAGALCAVSSFKQDCSRHLFLCAGNLLPIEITSYVIAIVVLAITGLAGLSLTAEWCGLPREILSMSAYGILLLFYCLFISRLLKTESWVIAFLPFAAAGSLLAAPVFTDLSGFLPLIGILKWATPVSFYLHLI